MNNEEIYNEYQNSVDKEIVKFVKDVLNHENKVKYITVGFISNSTSKELKKLTGKNVCGNRIVLDENAVLHINKRHGEKGVHDHSMKELDDLGRIGYVLANYDSLEYTGIKSYGYLDEEGKPSPVVLFKKRVDGVYYVAEAINSSSKNKCYIISAYIKKQ